MELVDASQLLPGLKRTPGLRRWRPYDKQKQAFFDTHDEARAVRESLRVLRLRLHACIRSSHSIVSCMSWSVCEWYDML